MEVGMSWKKIFSAQKLLPIFSVIETRRSVGGNPAFGEKFAKSQNEGTYVTVIIVPVVKASLKNYQ
ncbi:12380_t:CDS:2 [Acaulospora colombiana]|uniref:12380_t:CDS:1 n=1 Tax=Acaulospora colombiana TaxID=27376 RepID=A0ACA9KFH1_9GLOM|nr:12380_t:CDS:2 [Acaulospora colombiana]